MIERSSEVRHPGFSTSRACREALVEWTYAYEDGSAFRDHRIVGARDDSGTRGNYYRNIICLYDYREHRD